jgi:potassium channel subfamily K
MRKILHDASRRRRWTALGVSGSVWCILWFAGAAIFQAAERDQGWTYFESLYFAYTCLLTIGYGDYYPTSNSGKPFFVVWSLLAIPSLTILISNMSDTVVKFVNDITIWIGNVTILPGEGGIKLAITYPVAKVTRGKIFGNAFRATAPGLLGEASRPRMNRNQSSHHNYKKNDPESMAGQHDEQRGLRQAQKAQDAELAGNRGVPKSKKELHIVLIDEIANVTRDLNSDPPKKYDFEEWMWYLRLVGEDGTYSPSRSLGSSASTSREKEKDGETQRTPWSWVDANSPLMGGHEEPEWVLRRLTTRLQRELRRVDDGLDPGGEVTGRRRLESVQG